MDRAMRELVLECLVPGVGSVFAIDDGGRRRIEEALSNAARAGRAEAAADAIVEMIGLLGSWDGAEAASVLVEVLTMPAAKFGLRGIDIEAVLDRLERRRQESEKFQGAPRSRIVTGSQTASKGTLRADHFMAIRRA